LDKQIALSSTLSKILSKVARREPEDLPAKKKQKTQDYSSERKIWQTYNMFV